MQLAEAIADDVWHEVMAWDAFPREVLGGQMIRATDSIGANIAEAFGRYHYGEKLQFLYYARGSLYEAKYWLNRTMDRSLLSEDKAHEFSTSLSEIARQLNAFSRTIRQNRSKNTSSALRESPPTYKTALMSSDFPDFFDEKDFTWLAGASSHE